MKTFKHWIMFKGYDLPSCAGTHAGAVILTPIGLSMDYLIEHQSNIFIAFTRFLLVLTGVSTVNSVLCKCPPSKKLFF